MNWKISKLLDIRTIAVSSLLALFAFSASGIKADENKAKEHYNSAIKANQNGDTDAAILGYKGAISENPKFTDAYINLGAIYFGKKDYSNALEMFKKASELDKKNSDAFANLARVQTKLKRYAEAEGAYTTALSLGQDKIGLTKELGKVYFRSKKYDKVIESFGVVHKNKAGDYLTYSMLGKAFQKKGKKSEAITSYKKSVSLKKKNFSAQFALGQIYLGQGKYAKAASSFKAAQKSTKKKKYKAAYNYAIAVESQDPEAYGSNIVAWENYIKVAKNNAKAKREVTEARAHLKELREAKEQADLQ